MSTRYDRFDGFKFSKKLQEAVQEARFEKPTDLQKQVIPLVLEDRDVVFEAQSGMGKSVCFAIPFLQHWLRDRERKGMIITPSAPAVRQIGKVISRLCPILKARVMRFTADDDYFYPELLDKTPIVVVELNVVERFMRREKEYVQNIRSLALDEFDVLLESEEQLSTVVASLRPDRQTLICTNRMTEEVLERCNWYCDPTRLEKLKLTQPEARWSEDQVRLQYLKVTDENRFASLEDLIRPWGDAIVLIVTGSDRMSRFIVDRLTAAGLAGHLLAYSMPLDEKQSMVDEVQTAGNGVLVACEAAMNGLNVSTINHLISWELPGQFDGYWRRIDRFAYQNPLVATVLVNRSQMAAINVLERRLGRQMVEMDLSRSNQRSMKDGSAGGKGTPGERVLIAERFRMPVFTKADEVEDLAPGGLAKTLGSKFVPARKRR